jgi:hypothetical protein
MLFMYLTKQWDGTYFCVDLVVIFCETSMLLPSLGSSWVRNGVFNAKSSLHSEFDVPFYSRNGWAWPCLVIWDYSVYCVLLSVVVAAQSTTLTGGPGAAGCTAPATAEDPNPSILDQDTPLLPVGTLPSISGGNGCWRRCSWLAAADTRCPFP